MIRVSQAENRQTIWRTQIWGRLPRSGNTLMIMLFNPTLATNAVNAGKDRLHSRPRRRQTL
ncbi:hypothetical protein A0U91_11805 [Acetobacter persici]|uniref:Uncharacterized protein n=1 Tax=Acetobacter persici TaxID=1076596 RepID=A0A1U9LG67_9PROT|nr:hypothetical protein A0U91_11805 [Acetobacter persici]